MAGAGRERGAAFVRRGTNLPRMGTFNQSVILDAIRRSNAGMSRVELAGATGLSGQTISNIVRRLLDHGFIEEAGKTRAGRGKPRTILRLAPHGLYAIGVHLDPTVITVVILDLVGTVLFHTRQQTPTTNEPGDVITTIVTAVTELISQSDVDRHRIVGIGVAAPGPIDPDRGVVIDPPNLSGWHRVPLRETLSESTGLPVLLDKDVTAAAVAEMWAGGRSGTDSFVFFYLGTGIGAGLVLAGDVVRGISSNAGEIGHIVTDPSGPQCWCGQRGCVAVTCIPQCLVEEAEASGALGGAHAGTDTRAIDARFSELSAASENGAADATAIIDRSAERVARAVAVVANLLDVDRVVFGGPFWSRVADRYLKRVPALLAELQATRSIHEVSVAGTTVGEDVGAIGAACLVLDQALTPRPTTLLLAE